MATEFWPRAKWSVVNASFTSLPVADGWAIHHTGTLGATPTLDVARLRALESGEIRAGYSALAYHRYVAANGGVAEVRPWGKRGAATGGHNDHTLAIVLDGYFHPPHNQVPTDEAISAAADEIVWAILAGYATRESVHNIKPHRDWTAGTQWATACPGELLLPRVNGFGSIAALAEGRLLKAGTTVPAPKPAQPRCVRVASRRTLRRGDTGVNVRTLQNLLRSKGFNPGPTDGVFGRQTEVAVQWFQGATHLAVDGVVGPATWSALTR